MLQLSPRALDRLINTIEPLEEEYHKLQSNIILAQFALAFARADKTQKGQPITKEQLDKFVQENQNPKELFNMFPDKELINKYLNINRGKIIK